MRSGVVARGPSGAKYRLRQMNMERHALAGGFPPSLVSATATPKEALAALFTELADPDDGERERKREQHAEVLGYLDRIVLDSVIEPKLTKQDLGDQTKLDDDPLLPPVDYRWLVNVAFRVEDTDADGKRIWGVRSLDDWHWFRLFHECAEDCTGCAALQVALSAAVGGPNGAVAAA